MTYSQARTHLCYRLGLTAVSVALAGCGNQGSHSLVPRLTVALDSSSLVIRNPSGVTYYETEVDVNDVFRWHVDTLAPGARRTVQLDSLRDGTGQHLTRRTRVADIWCYAQDSAGNFGTFTWYPPAKKP